MKTRQPVYLLLLLAIISYFPGCRKTNEFIEPDVLAHLEEPESFPVPVSINAILSLEYNALIPFPQSGTFNCLARPLYNDSVLYNGPDASKHFIVGLSNNPGPGRFYSWPKGLVIDSVTGSINVTASQGGYRYVVGYVKTGTRDTCLQNIILSGATYKDSIYVIGNNDTLAYPYFNADPVAASICDDSGDEDYQDDKGNGNGNHKCEFDAEDNNGTKGRANMKHVKVRTISGIINLKKTLEEGAFGSANPINGQGLVVPVFYKLNDRGNKALQKVNVQVIYYHSTADIPVELVQYIARRRKLTETRMPISENGSPRPPLIVITRS